MDANSPRPISVLLVDDDEDDYILIRQTFERIKNSLFTLEWTSDFDIAKDLIATEKHDLYLIDYRLGEHSGLDLLESAHAETRMEPFIILTGAGDEELQKKALERAASEYLVKGAFGPELLSRTMQYAIGRKRVEQQRLDHLKELNRSKDEFISIASHQLRTPATGVKQYLGMLLEGFIGEMDESQKQILTKAYQSNERQLRIVADLLKVAQVDAGKVRLRKTSVNIDELITDIINEQSDVVKSRHQKVIFNPSKEGNEVLIDRDDIRMVLENIIDNASKYSPDSTKITITVGADDNFVMAAIADEGVGVQKEDRGRLFEKFSRIDNELSTKVGGTGLGLYWAKKIVDLHDGIIEYAAAKKGKGSIFTIKLPKHEL